MVINGVLKHFGASYSNTGKEFKEAHVNIQISENDYVSLCGRINESGLAGGDICSRPVTVFTDDDNWYAHLANEKAQENRIEQLEKENQELREQVKDLENDRNMWKEKCGSAITDIFRTLSSDSVGVEFNFVGFGEAGNLLFTMDFPELDKAKKKIEELKKDLDLVKNRAEFWRDRTMEVKKELRNLKRKTVAEARYEWKPNCFTMIYTMCDGSKQTVGMDFPKLDEEQARLRSIAWFEDKLTKSGIMEKEWDSWVYLKEKYILGKKED